MELIKKDKQNVAVEIPDDLKDVFNIAQNMEGVIPRLPQISIIHRGQMFELPGGEKLGEFEGVILDQHRANAWWEADISESGGGSVPDCYSMDGVTPVDSEKRQSDKCAECRHNQFGSDRRGTGGKDCKNMKRLHIIMEDSTLPRRLTIPPTSIRKFDEYMTELVDRGLPYMTVITKFGLEKKINKSFEYAEIKLQRDRVLSQDELRVVAEKIKQFKAPARQQEIQSDEYINEEDADSNSYSNSSNNYSNSDDPGPQEEDIPF